MVNLIDQQLRNRRENNGVRVIISSIVCLLVVGVSLWHYHTSVTNKIRSEPEEDHENNINNMSSDEQKAAEVDDSTKAREEWENHRDELYDCLMHPTAASSSSSSQSSHGVPTLLKTLDAAVRILKLARMIDSRLQNNPKIDVFYQQLETIERNCNSYARQGYGSNIKVLVIEGLASSGKSTLANRLKVITRGTAITELPSQLVEIQYLFTSALVPESVLAALEHVFNYFTAHQIIHNARTQSSFGSKDNQEHLVIVEQSYHASCARTICANITNDVDLTTLQRSAFEWPIDLPIPHLVMFLTLSTATRMQRSKHVGRGSSLTERSSERNVARDARAQMAYSLIRGPSTIALDASVGPDDVLDAALEACEEFGLYKPPPVGKGKGDNKRASLGLYGAFTR